MTCARRGVSLEQRTHRPLMFQSFLLLSQRLRTPFIALMPATALRGTGPLRSLLRKACALSCASLSTAESALKKRAGQPLALINGSTRRLRLEDSCQRWRTALVSIGAVDRSLQSEFS